MDLPKAAKTEDIVLSDRKEELYKKLVNTIGVDALLLIHKKHYKDFLINIEVVKKEAIEEYKMNLKNSSNTK
jgi:hypothetical protein